MLSLGVVVGSVSRNGGGVSAAVRNLTSAILAKGSQVTAYGVKDQYTERDLSAWGPVLPQVFGSFGPRTFGYAPELGRALTTAEHDLVHQHGLWLPTSAQILCWRKRTSRPVVISPHGMLDQWALRNSSWKKRVALAAYEKANLNGAACLHALNVAEARAIRSFGLRNPLAIIPNGVDLPDPGAILPKPSFTYDDRHILLFLGRLHPKKGLKELIEAWALLKRHAPDVVDNWLLTIVGWDDGGHLAGLRSLVQRYGLYRDVIFPGPIHGTAKLGVLASASAFILPSYSEGLPVAVLEAWAHAQPVFMTGACNLPEGFASDAAIEITTEPEEIATQLADHLPDPALHERGHAGQKLVVEQFTWPRIAGMHDAVFRWLVRGSPKPTHVYLSDERLPCTE